MRIWSQRCPVRHKATTEADIGSAVHGVNTSRFARRKWFVVLLGGILLCQVLVSTAIAFVPGGFWRWHGIGFGPGYHAHGCCQSYGQQVPAWTVVPEDIPPPRSTRLTPVRSW